MSYACGIGFAAANSMYGFFRTCKEPLKIFETALSPIRYNYREILFFDQVSKQTVGFVFRSRCEIKPFRINGCGGCRCK
jgi:hypothetical protein